MKPESPLHQFASAFVRALSRQDAAERSQALKDCWHLFRHASQDRDALSLRVRRTEDGLSLLARRGSDRPLPVTMALDPAEREQGLPAVGALFGEVHIQLVALLPGLQWEVFKAAAALLVNREVPLQRAWLERHIHHVIALGIRPRLRMNRELPLPVAESLDMLHGTLEGLTAVGPGAEESPAAVIARVGRFLVRRLDTPAHVMMFLSSLDLVLGRYPEAQREQASALLVAAVPEEFCGPVLEGCDRMVAMAGGAHALQGKLDHGGIPMAGYHRVATAIRLRRKQMAKVDDVGPVRAVGRAHDGSGLIDVGWGPVNAGASSGAGASPPAGWGDRRPATGGPPGHPPAAETRPFGPSTPEPSAAGTAARRGGTPPPVPSRAVTRPLPTRGRDHSGMFSVGAATPTPGARLGSAESDSGLSSPGVSLFAEEDRPVPPPRPLDERVPSWIASFEKHRRSLLARVREARDDARYVGTMKILSNVGGAYLDEMRWADALPIVRLLKAEEARSSPFSEKRRRAIADALFLIFTPRGVEPMVATLPAADFADRVALCELIAHYKHAAVPELVKLLLTRKLHSGVRREVTALIEGAGPMAGPALVDAIERHSRRWNRMAPLLDLTGSIGFRAGERKLAEFLSHKQPRIRDVALVGLYKMLEHRAQRYLLAALDDSDPRTCQTALTLLAACRSEDGNFLGLLFDLVGLDEPDNPAEEGLILGALGAIGDLGNVLLVQGVDAETAVSDALRESVRSGLFGLGSARSGRSMAIQRALCDVLGQIGSTRGRAMLQQALRDGPPALKEAAESGLQRMQQRG